MAPCIPKPPHDWVHDSQHTTCRSTPCTRPLPVQVASYRCIVSHETPALQAFTLCVLQRHNCLGLHAPIPQRPAPEPMASFRGRPLTHDTAEDIFIGWLGTSGA